MAWYRSTTNTTSITTMDTPANALGVLKTFFDACAAEGASFLWEVSGSDTSAPRYVCLKRKSGAAGRLLFFGGTAPDASVLGYSVTSNTSQLYVGYDRTATSDTILTSYATGRPFNGTVANWHLGRPFGACTATSGDLRAYCNSSSDSIAIFWYSPADWVFRGTAIAGLWLRNEAGTACEGLIANGGSTFVNGLMVEPYSNTLSVTGSCQSVRYTTVYDSGLNEMVRLAGFQTPGINIAYAQSYQNERFISPGGYVKFSPFTYAVVNGGSVPENRMYSSRYMGWGPMKVLNGQWTDNTAASKGYYIGNVGTSDDLSGFSLLDDSF